MNAGGWMLIIATIGLGLVVCFIAHLLMRIEDRLHHLNSTAMIWLSGHSVSHAVFTPYELHRQLARAQVAHELYVRAVERHEGRRNADPVSADGLKALGEYAGAVYDRDYEAWRYSLMVEANLKVALGKATRIEALEWTRAQQPNIFDLPRSSGLRMPLDSVATDRTRDKRELLAHGTAIRSNMRRTTNVVRLKRHDHPR
jgi:hypothetical protein